METPIFLCFGSVRKDMKLGDVREIKIHNAQVHSVTMSDTAGWIQTVFEQSTREDNGTVMTLENKENN